MDRSSVLRTLAEAIGALDRPHPIRVGIDGVDAAGKTTFADALVEPLEVLGRPVVRATVDAFHRPRRERYLRGRSSPEGYFLDSFDHAALRSRLLEPLGPGGSLRFRRETFDHVRDVPIAGPDEVADVRSVLLLDGIFLHRPELADCFELSVFLDVPFEVSRPRAARRDGSSPAVDAPEARRYVEGQRIYLRRCTPAARATVSLRNDDPDRPRWLRAPRVSGR